MENKTIYLKTKLKIGDILTVGDSLYVIDEEFIKNYPDLVLVREEYPEYFMCTHEGVVENFTKGRIYKRESLRNFPEVLTLYNDNGIISNIYQWEIRNESNNNTCFKPVIKERFDKQELLDKAKRDYPIGTKFLSATNHNITDSFEVQFDLIWEGNRIVTQKFGAAVYDHNKKTWAKIVPLKFITEDGVDIYGDMKTWKVSDDNSICQERVFNGLDTSCKYFYYEENALEYMKKHKEKSLEDYENILFDDMSTFTFASEKAYFSIWGWIKDEEPKLYYTKILQLIADDLNDGWIADFSGFNNPVKYYLTSSGWTASFNIDIPGVVYFKSEKLAQKAREILGDKLPYLFKQVK